MKRTLVCVYNSIEIYWLCMICVGPWYYPQIALYKSHHSLCTFFHYESLASHFCFSFFIPNKKSSSFLRCTSMRVCVGNITVRLTVYTILFNPSVAKCLYDSLRMSYLWVERCKKGFSLRKDFSDGFFDQNGLNEIIHKIFDETNKLF